MKTIAKIGGSEDFFKRGRKIAELADLEKTGLLEIEDIPFPGRGRKKEVRVIADQILLAL